MSEKPLRCAVCNAELSACGEMTADGPRMDCRECQLEAELSRLRSRIRREDHEEALREVEELRKRCEELRVSLRWAIEICRYWWNKYSSHSDSMNPTHFYEREWMIRSISELTRYLGKTP